MPKVVKRDGSQREGILKPPHFFVKNSQSAQDPIRVQGAVLPG